MLQLYYNVFVVYSFLIFPLAPVPLTPLFPSLNSVSISSIVIYLYFSVKAIFSATTSGSKKSIKILAGDEAKFAPC